MTLARLMRFYSGGVTVADFDEMPWSRLQVLVSFMDQAESAQREHRG